MKKYFLGSFLVALITLLGVTHIPQVSIAATPTVSELERRITSLTEQIITLKKQLAEQKASSTTSIITPKGGGTEKPEKPSGMPRVCFLLNRSLTNGSQGDDVRSLQEYLKSEGYFSMNATGYFGPVTGKAVSAWQQSQGLSSVGAVGPMTRARLTERCNGWSPTPTPPPSSDTTLKASPTSGSAPLKTTFSTWLSGFRAPGVSYELDFGDGSSVVPTSCLAPADACIEPGKDTHTYIQNGTYTAVLYRTTNPCGGNPLCMAPVSREAIGKATVFVGEKACTLEYNPVCGQKQIICIKAPCNPIEQTYGNMCALEADGATLLHKGECGTSSGNLAPVISSLSGPTTLTLSEEGTWSIKATDPENGTLSYEITWGDEIAKYDSMMGASAPQEMTTQTTTFTHRYTRTGTYTIIVVVRDESGNEAKTTTTVKVGSAPTACTKIYSPVCGMPSGCKNTCPPGMYCAMLCQMPDPVTYSNTCTMEAAGATKLYDGACKVDGSLPTR